MSNPQIEDGFMTIANEIVDAFCKVDLSPHESRLLWFILRKTYGFKKKTDWIALSQFTKSTGIERRRVWRALQRMSSRRVIVVSRDDKNRPTYGFQKDYSQWKLSSRKATVVRKGDKLSSVRGTQLSSVKAPTKETLTKERTCVSAKAPRPTDPRVKEFIDWFVTGYLKRFGQRYHVLGGKDGQLVKNLLQTFDIVELQNRTLRLWESGDHFIARTGRGIGILANQINNLAPLLQPQLQPQFDRPRGDLTYGPKLDRADHG